ncbi:MAG: helix-hairpin-helix domain-containing protein [Bacteroidota bacterium]
MDNYQIADSFSLLSKLMDIHGENSFKAKSYASASFAIEKLSVKLIDTPFDKIASLNGIGISTGQKIIEFLQNGKIFLLEEMISKTPSGIIEMLNIKGIGPKKINTIWKEMEIETVGELLYACKENRLKLYKGFGEKTQQNVIHSIEFYNKNRGRYLYAQAAQVVNEFEIFLSTVFPNQRIENTGMFKRQMEIVDQIEFIIEGSPIEIENKLSESENLLLIDKKDNSLQFSTPAGINLIIYPTEKSLFISRSIQLSSSEDFWNELLKSNSNATAFPDSTYQFFADRSLPLIPEFSRENPEIVSTYRDRTLPDCIKVADIKGIIHSHSNWSDGNNTIEEMGMACIEMGMEYLVISDHSKSAFYAQGLSVEKIMAQHEYIDSLNKKLAPFRIFKSIESDILFDGSLDYEEDVLKKFDLVIASVHSNLKMNEEKAMMRLIKAIENPYTTILGHMTGRLLLSRPGYPVDHKKIIDACAANNVVIELNAHPSRLDIDWRQINYALEKNVLISINPDAHTLEGLKDIQYGVLVAQKALLTKEKNLSSFSLIEMIKHLELKK